MTVKIQLKKNTRATLITTIIIVLVFSALLVSLPLTSAQPNSPHLPSNMDPVAVIDIQLTDLTFSNDEPLEDDKVIISVIVSNNGSQRLENISISFYLDMEELGVVSGITIEANESLTVNYTWTAEKWDHIISAMINIADSPLKETTISKEIFVETKPVDDLLSLVLALVSFFVVVLVICCIPSLLRSLRG
jgi:hypothetical protein